MGADKVLLFVRSVDLEEREAIGIELEEDEGANGLTEDWSKVDRVCQRMDEERAGKAKRKVRDGAPSQQEEGERKGAAARLGFETRIAEAYAALEAMLEAEGENLPCEMAEDLLCQWEAYVLPAEALPRCLRCVCVCVCV